jgi:DNA-binding response OmpR family regulator
MRVCVVSGAPEALEEVLAQAGHEVKACLSTDMAVAVAEKHSAEVVVFCEDVPEVGGVTREQVLGELKRRFRVVLVASRDNPLVAPAAGLGVRDFVFVPASPAAVLHRVENEASHEEAAAALSGISLPGISPEDLAAIARRNEAEREKDPVWSKFIRSALGRGARLPGPEKAPEPEDAGAEEGEPAEKEKGRRLAVPQVRLPRLPRVGFRAGKPVEEGTAPAAAPAKTPAGGAPPAEERRAVRVFPQVLAAVWSPSGFMVSFTALNLAVAAARMGYDVALLNFNLACPETDFWFGVRQTKPAACRVEDAGIMTFASSMTPELALRMLEKRGKTWGIKYLPAGNKLGNIGTPDFGEGALDLFRDIIAAVHSREGEGARLTVVEAGSWFEQPPVMAALTACPVVVVPLLGGPQEKAVLDMHLEELGRLGVKPEVVKFYPLDVDGALWRESKKPPALEGSIAVWRDLIVAVAEKCGNF